MGVEAGVHCNSSPGDHHHHFPILPNLNQMKDDGLGQPRRRVCRKMLDVGDCGEQVLLISECEVDRQVCDMVWLLAALVGSFAGLLRAER